MKPTFPSPTHISESKIDRCLTVRIPGSTANLGPAFDTMALALRLYTWLQFIVLKEDDRNIPLVTREGEIAQTLPEDESNLAYQVAISSVEDPALKSRLRLSIFSELPLGRGLGSSASAIVGALYGAARLTDKSVDKEALILRGSQFESHIDNLSASVLGGLSISMFDPMRSKAVCHSLTWPSKWRTLIVIPCAELSTEKARSVLPNEYPRADVVANLQRVALLSAAVSSADERLLKESLYDRLHEPYRSKLAPVLNEVRTVISDTQALGCVLSGAGTAVLVIVHEKDKYAVLDTLKRWAAKKETTISSVLDLEVDSDGLLEVS